MAAGSHADIDLTGITDGDLFKWDAADGEMKRYVPVAAIASPSGGATVDAAARTAIDAIRAALTAAHITA